MTRKFFWIEWIEQEMFTKFKDRKSTKKKSSPTPSNIASFFGCIVPYGTNTHQIQFESNLMLFIAKELVLCLLLSYHSLEDEFRGKIPM
jgi:hypothetical protein